MTVDKQVVILYALTKGHLDDIPVEDITRFEDEFLGWVGNNAPHLYQEIRETKGLPADEKFIEAINAFKKVFKKSV